MRPTLPPWAWVSWERRGRSRAAESVRERRRDAPRRRTDHYAIYEVRKDSRRFLRLDRLGKSLVLSRPWASGTAAPAAWLYERYDTPPPPPPWTDLDIKPSVQSVALGVGTLGGSGAIAGASRAGGAGVAGATGAAGEAGAGGALHGLVATAIILTVLTLVVRATENSLKTTLKPDPENGDQEFLGEGRRYYTVNGEEWYPPNATVTSQSQAPPPSYAECVSAPAPPPYAAPPYPAAAPATHITPRQDLPHERPHTNTDFDNVQNDLIENGIGITAASTPNNTDRLDSGDRTEMVFAQGRVLERNSTDNNTNSDKTTGNGAEEPSNDTVVFIDETAASNAMPGRVLLV